MKPTGPNQAASWFQFSLGTLLLALVSVVLVGGMLAEEVRLKNLHRKQVNNYVVAWMDRRTTMTRDDVRSFFDVPPTPESAGTDIEVFQWRGWLFTHEYMIGFSPEGRPTTTIGVDRPRLGIGALVLAVLAVFWSWRWCRWIVRGRKAA
jgi:hypothetical protein